MVVQYLEKIRDKYQKEMLEMRVLLKDVNNKQKENMEFIKLLEAKDDTNYEAFTPRKVNSFNKTKIEELKEEQILLQNKIEKYQKNINSLEIELEEIESVMKEARKLEKKL